MAYEHFYQFYDSLMDDVPYKEYIRLIEQYGLKDHHILDMGCGTGNVLVPLIEEGYHVDGLDVSDEMLLMTSEKLMQKGLFTNLYNDDMREIEISDYYQLIYSFVDTINYLTKKEDVFKTFQNVHKALTDEGYFLFDVHSLYKVHHIFDGYCYNDTDEDITYLWNTYVKKSKTFSTVDHELTFFIKQKTNVYKRLDEFHRQVVFDFNFYKECLEKSGFQLVNVLFDFDSSKTCENCHRIIFISKKFKS